jgi:hypothetical protein
VRFTVCLASAFTAGSLFFYYDFAGALSVGWPETQAVDFVQVLLFYLPGGWFTFRANTAAVHSRAKCFIYGWF